MIEIEFDTIEELERRLQERGLGKEEIKTIINYQKEKIKILRQEGYLGRRIKAGVYDDLKQLEESGRKDVKDENRTITMINHEKEHLEMTERLGVTHAIIGYFRCVPIENPDKYKGVVSILFSSKVSKKDLVQIALAPKEPSFWDLELAKKYSLVVEK